MDTNTSVQESPASNMESQLLMREETYPGVIICEMWEGASRQREVADPCPFAGWDEGQVRQRNKTISPLMGNSCL